ncbi:hypothetical protein H0266_18275 [Halobacillus locisalis]|uniref:Type II secretion system protein GspF domain-containing protein n=1 Tax=Halobacillus locisalis TaxID=220753 RepID=A0A838CYA7_9BACI|nr:hypothetical protein [Halobacillus locisalis]MBA2176829.1 hypothetical protein [Halobacillus locisalis]
MYWLLDAAVGIIGYTSLIVGIWMIAIQPLLMDDFKRLKRRFKRSRQLRLANKEVTTKEGRSAIGRHVRYILLALNYKESAVDMFFFSTITLFGVTFAFVYMNIKDVVIAGGISLIIACIPYIVLRFMVIRKRLHASLVFLNEFSNFIQVYQSTRRDIYYTIMNMAKETQDKHLKQSYMGLMSSIQKDRNQEEFKESVYIFVYSINSSFVKRLGKLIIKSYLDGTDISSGLNDLNNDIKKRKKDMATEKTSKLDAIMTGYLPAILLPASLFGAWKISGVVAMDEIFFDPLVFTVFTISTVMTIISVLLTIINQKPKAYM